MLSAHHVSISGKHGDDYSKTAPFHPDAVFPEYPFSHLQKGGANPAYRAVREVLWRLGMDRDRFGTAQWNPLGSLVGPGATVVIKPNLVLDRHPRGGPIDALITHGSVVRAILDFVHVALKGSGRVIVGDSPLQTTDFAAAVKASGIDAVVDFYRGEGRDVELVDFRQVHAQRDERGHIASWKEVPGDPRGTVTFDLGDRSALAPLSPASPRFRVSNYKASDTAQYHGAHEHRYVMARSIFDADLVIDVPKMKTHCKVGVTLGLKNFVGTVSRKQCLAHHRAGGPEQGGDEFPHASRLKALSEQLERMIDGNAVPGIRHALKLAYRVNERLIRMLGIDDTRDGGWHGNDTAWRMTLDLARIVAYGRTDGTMADSPQRAMLTLVDGIVAGEGEGPLEAVAKPTGTVVAGLNVLATDLVTATLMGFDYRQIPLLNHALDAQTPWPLAHFSAAQVKATLDDRMMTLAELARSGQRMRFLPPKGWAGRMELSNGTATP
jgi:uncharacterized protein (DUF362 family)